MISLLWLWLAGLAWAGPLADGVELMEAGELDAAVAVWQPVADGGSASGRLYYDLGSAWYRKGEYERAISDFNRAIELEPQNNIALFNLGVAKEATHD